MRRIGRARVHPYAAAVMVSAKTHQMAIKLVTTIILCNSQRVGEDENPVSGCC